MRKICLVIVICLLTGCAFSTGPLNEKEAFPQRNQGPIGLIINEGEVNLNLFIFDKADRLVEQIYISGANRFLSINNRSLPRHWTKKISAGEYQVEIYPFYYQTDLTARLLSWLSPLFGPGRRRIDLPKQIVHLNVGRGSTNTYYDGKYWGWILRLNGGSIPKTSHGLPGIQYNFRGNFNRKRR